MYEVEIPRSVARQLSNLPRHVRERILANIRQLRQRPRPRDCRKLTSEEDLYRIRVGSYRVIYRVDDDHHCVVLCRVAHRREVYR